MNEERRGGRERERIRGHTTFGVPVCVSVPVSLLSPFPLTQSHTARYTTIISSNTSPVYTTHSLTLSRIHTHTHAQCFTQKERRSPLYERSLKDEENYVALCCVPCVVLVHSMTFLFLLEGIVSKCAREKEREREREREFVCDGSTICKFIPDGFHFCVTLQLDCRESARGMQKMNVGTFLKHDEEALIILR